MKTNPGQLSLVLALIFAVFLLFLSVLFQYLFFDTYNTLFSLALSAVFVPVFYIVFRTALEKFIYEKIKIIYKTIRKSYAGQRKGKNGGYNSDILDAVNLEVEQWAASQAQEIQDLKKLETYRREFLGNVSHELKTPITTIQGYVLTLLDGGMDDPKVNKKYLLRTAKSINRLIAIVNDLETISHFEAGIIQLQKSKFNFTLTLLEVFDFMEMKAQKRNIQLVYNGNPEVPCYVMGEKEKIRQVLINLIDNSLKYGNESGTTTVSIFDMDDHVLIEMSDDGIGIEESDLPRIFERFYRTEKSRARAQGGTGLGLAIVKHIIEAHEQTIHVSSNVGVGSTFSFTLKKA
jgi:two-component system, OmpR family, phosphate regulon sensor histidine kinase PhoR